MRTPEQIENLRKVLWTMIGIGAFILTDEDIDDWANELERNVNNRKVKWIIKVRLKENENLPWENIKPERNFAIASFGDINIKCRELLDTYPLIHAIQITDGFVYYLFDRKEKEKK